MKKTYILLDRSSSMVSLWDEALGSVNGYVNKLKESATDGIEIKLDVFDNVSYDTLRNVSIENWVDINSNEASPRGATPLFDAAGRLFEEVLKEKPEKAVIVIMTDGEENNSTNYTQSEIKKKVKLIEETGYQVIFLGADFGAVDKEAAKFGLGSNKSFNSSKKDLGNTMRGLSAATLSYYSNPDAEIINKNGIWLTGLEKDIIEPATNIVSDLTVNTVINAVVNVPAEKPVKKTTRKTKKTTKSGE